MAAPAYKGTRNNLLLVPLSARVFLPGLLCHARVSHSFFVPLATIISLYSPTCWEGLSVLKNSFTPFSDPRSGTKTADS
jgi:hypothetical protein